MPGRLIAIGDIHGCSEALAALLKAIQPTAGDRIITLGDYVDRGPDSRGVIDQLLELQRRCWLIPLMGNHDMMLLGLAEGHQYVFNSWIGQGGGPTLQSFRCAHPREVPERYLSFLRGCRSMYETPGTLFVHANYMPNRPIEEQPKFVQRWESLRSRCPPAHYSGKTVIVGHTSQRSGEILDLGYLKCIDTYCYGGRWLTALDAETGEVWQTNQFGQLRTAVEQVDDAATSA